MPPAAATLPDPVTELELVDLPLETVDGAPTTLGAITPGQVRTVVLMRQVRCLFCADFTAELVERRAELGQLVLVGHSVLPAMRELLERTPSDVVVLRDPHQLAYDALDIGRGRLLRLTMHPRVLVPTLRAIAGGRTGMAPLRGDDARRLGGVVVLGPSGEPSWIARTRGPEDWPTPSAVVAQVAAAAAR